MKKTLMFALAATVISGSAFAQTDSTKTESTDSTVVTSTDSTSTPTQDKKDEKTPPHAFVAPTLQNNTFALVATNRELVGNKAVEVENEEA